MSSATAPPAPTSFRMEDPGREPIAPEPAKPAGPTLEQRLESMERELQETRESRDVWQGIANRTAPPARPAKEAPPAPVTDGIDWGKDDDIAVEADDSTPESLIDDLSKIGTKALAKHGFVRKSDVIKIARDESRRAAATASKQVVQRARTEVTSETQIMSEFPDLKDEKSEFYKLTAANVADAVRLDPSSASSTSMLYLAAKAAKAQLGDKPAPRGRQQSADDDDPPTRRTARDEHIAAQHGDRGRSRSSVDTNEDPDGPGLNEAELEVAKSFGLDAKTFKANKVALNRQTTRGRR